MKDTILVINIGNIVPPTSKKTRPLPIHQSLVFIFPKDGQGDNA